MSRELPFEIQASGTEALILRATYEALLEYGYTELTITRIGTHFGKTNSLIYQYYSSKDELLVELLRQLLARFEDVSVKEDEDAHEQVLAAVKPKSQTDPAMRGIVTAVLTLRAQAPHNSAFKQEFENLDDAYLTHLTALIELGIEQGRYTDVPPRAVAEYLYAVMTGADFITVTADGDFTTAAVLTELEQYLQTRLLVD